MTPTIRRTVRAAAYFTLLLLSALGATGQSAFQNLGFENTTLTAILVNDFSLLYTTNATVPGWSWSPHETFGWGDPNTTVSFNNMALDSPAVTLHGTNSFYPALLGKYSILLQGGSHLIPPQYASAWISQTGQVPVTAHSLIYLGASSLQVTFNGQSLLPFALETSATYIKWGIDISPYAGQLGDLRFGVPGGRASMLDGIRFSSNPIPEPSAFSLSLLGTILATTFTRRLITR
jgi:hypothetical protein